MIKLVITDLDDTLYSWIGFYIPAFYKMAGELARLLDVSEDELIEEYRQVHREANSVEPPFAALRLPTVKKKFAGDTAEEIGKELDSAFHLFNSERKRLLKLYPGVEEALQYLAQRKITVVGYTESAEENGYYRLERLGIADYFKEVYVSASYGERPGKRPKSPKTHIVSEKKPNPDLIIEICKKENITPSETLYMGDSLSKDMLMAKKAGVRSVWCHVPNDNPPDLYEKLVRISHWSQEDFSREEQYKREWTAGGYVPDFTITDFGQLKDIILCCRDL
ncbi:MAG: HAD family hydrolase [Clostridium sp.]|nr:HAD family hydrolase [Clostridium sp.]